ncbi:hypothetical protein HR060_05005 [Catenovulum sp. SM1970]|uniref:S24/S26 family peptidase n=1 Tax=Marinifaba aquimaris TaxID=2741323 RepID=UPI001574102D|nr:S24/S26 family peptidase [Marinifaba aquimaris]NTS76220.1 hypothetical protein [Marinifaba aquimaris]
MFFFSVNHVASQSMTPVIPLHSYVMFSSLFRKGKLKIGDIVKVDHPIYGLMVRTVKFIDRNGFFWLKGENDHGLTTMEMGPIRPHNILAKAVWVLSSAKDAALNNKNQLKHKHTALTS